MTMRKKSNLTMVILFLLPSFFSFIVRVRLYSNHYINPAISLPFFLTSKSPLLNFIVLCCCFVNSSLYTSATQPFPPRNIINKTDSRGLH